MKFEFGNFLKRGIERTLKRRQKGLLVFAAGDQILEWKMWWNVTKYVQEGNDLDIQCEWLRVEGPAVIFKSGKIEKRHL